MKQLIRFQELGYGVDVNHQEYAYIANISSGNKKVCRLEFPHLGSLRPYEFQSHMTPPDPKLLEVVSDIIEEIEQERERPFTLLDSNRWGAVEIPIPGYTRRQGADPDQWDDVLKKGRTLFVKVRDTKRTNEMIALLKSVDKALPAFKKEDPLFAYKRLGTVVKVGVLSYYVGGHKGEFSIAYEKGGLTIADPLLGYETRVTDASEAKAAFGSLLQKIRDKYAIKMMLSSPRHHFEEVMTKRGVYDKDLRNAIYGVIAGRYSEEEIELACAQKGSQYKRVEVSACAWKNAYLLTLLTFRFYIKEKTIIKASENVDEVVDSARKDARAAIEKAFTLFGGQKSLE